MTFGDADWRNTPELAEPMFAAFTVMRQLHELLWCLAEAATLTAPGQLADDVECAGQRTAELTRARAAELAAVDTGAFRRGFGPLLERVSRSVRDGVDGRQPDRCGAELMGAKLAGADFRGASLRGAYLIGADLHRKDLRGTHLRGADLRGAQLDEAAFLTQPQLAAANGDPTTSIPAALSRPDHWTPLTPITPPPGTP